MKGPKSRMPHQAATLSLLYLSRNLDAESIYCCQQILDLGNSDLACNAVHLLFPKLPKHFLHAEINSYCIIAWYSYTVMKLWTFRWLNSADFKELVT